MRATVYALVKEWSETKGLDPHLVLMSAGAATLLGVWPRMVCLSVPCLCACLPGGESTNQLRKRQGLDRFESG